jgi:hypothetical protein
MVDVDKAKCKGHKKDGNACGAPAMPGQEHCFFHAPGREQERAAARSRGGQASRRKAAVLPADAEDVPLTTVVDVVKLLGQTVNETRKGQLDVKVANALGYLLSVALRALQDSDLEKRIANLESQRQNHNGTLGRIR